MMRDRSKTIKVFVAALMLFGFVTSTAAAQGKKEKKPAPVGLPVLWRAPDDLPARDLFLGPGGREMQPDLSRVTFVKEETGGYSKKYRVRDGARRDAEKGEKPKARLVGTITGRSRLYQRRTRLG